MDKMRMATPDFTDSNIQKLAELFPSVVTETRSDDGKTIRKAVNFDMLRQLLSKDLVEGDEAYEFTWVGKKESILEAGRAIRKTLRPCKEESKNWDTTENLYIEGDNLDVLKLLQESYLGKIKMIYIDPPYNTGNDFVYKDNFAKSKDEYNEVAGVYDEDGDKLFKNTESNGRFHSDWCSMMYPRLMLARNLLSDDGVIFISIDDNEFENLKKLCDEILGEANFVNLVAINAKNIAGASGGGEDKRLKKNLEYLLIYSKNYTVISQFKNIYTYTPISELVELYRNEGISWKYTSALIDPGEKIYIASTVDGDGEEIKIYKRENYKILSISQIIRNEHITEKEAYEKYAHCIFQTAMPQSSIRPRVMRKVEEIGISSDLHSIEYVPKSGKNKGKMYEQFYKGDSFRLFAWLKDVSEEINGVLCKADLQGTYWDFVGETKNLAKEGSISFPNGKKPVKMIKQMLSMIDDKECFILDFFSGSASTAHATMQLNAEDGGNRKFIMVQLPENCPPDVEEGFKNICEIGKERIRRAGEKIKSEQSSQLQGKVPDIGFRVLKVDDTNMKDVYYGAADIKQGDLLNYVSNVKEGRSELDLLFQCILEYHLPLTLSHTTETIDDVNIHTYAYPSDDEADSPELVACFNENMTENVVRHIAKKHPVGAVFRDTSFASSPAKINVAEIFKALSPGTEIRVL